MPFTPPTHPRIAILFTSLVLVVLVAWGSSQKVAVAQQVTPTPNQGDQVNVFANQTTIVVVPSPRPDAPHAIVFFATDDREAVKAGDVVTYRAVVQNPREDDLNEIRVTAHIPDHLVPLETSPAAEANAQARTLVWNSQTISARSEVTFAFRAQVVADVPAGTLVRTTAEIHGPGVRASSTDQTLIEAGRVATASTNDSPVAPVSVASPTPVVAAVSTTARTGMATTSLGIAVGALIAGSVLAGWLRTKPVA